MSSSYYINFTYLCNINDWDDKTYTYIHTQPHIGNTQQV